MGEARIKGTGIEQAVADVRRLVDAGRIARDALEARLQAEDLALLETKIQAAQWYPNECHCRLTELLRDVEGGGREEYVVERGAATAQRLLEAGIYRQVRYADEAEAGTVRELLRAVRLMITLSGAVYSFGTWSVHTDPKRPREISIVVTEAQHLTEMNRLTALGFIRQLAARLGEHPSEVTSRRDGPDRVIMRIRVDDRTPL